MQAVQELLVQAERLAPQQPLDQPAAAAAATAALLGARTRPGGLGRGQALLLPLRPCPVRRAGLQEL